MFLKRLELHGFKTFADRTELEFNPGVTAIVGPNGSGKSNIFDAIRWALGETSHKMLRSIKTEDVIFAGSERRKALGMAHVQITIENSDEELPLEFTEVTVGRRANRAGEGEYFLNGVTCRLRDVHELLMDTGLGAKAYSIIEQGKIGMILSTRPADRRQLIEEAAGITKYKSRRRAAELKLEAAQQTGLAVHIVTQFAFAAAPIRDVFARFPHIGPVLPAVGYDAVQLAALRATIAAAPVDAVVQATPSDLAALIVINKPVVRGRYVYGDGEPSLAAEIDRFLAAHGFAGDGP